MNKKMSGTVLFIIGVLGLVVVYSLRPPSGFGEAFMMLGQGRQSFINDPYFTILMGLFGVLTLLGLVKMISAGNSPIESKDTTPKP